MSLDFETIRVKVEGTTALLMHNVTYSANPLSQLSKTTKKFTGKRKKTDNDHEILFKLDWLGGLYCAKIPEIIADDQTVVFNGGQGLNLPYRMIKAMLINAAKKSKDGTTVKQGIIVTGDAKFNFPDKKEFDKQENPFEWLYQKEQYIDTSLVTVNRSKVLRTRGIFQEWSAEFNVSFLPELLNFGDIERFLMLGGKVIGFGDYRPDYGQFEVTDIQTV